MSRSPPIQSSLFIMVVKFDQLSAFSAVARVRFVPVKASEFFSAIGAAVGFDHEDSGRDKEDHRNEEHDAASRNTKKEAVIHIPQSDYSALIMKILSAYVPSSYLFALGMRPVSLNPKDSYI